jgi:hypothetical protein
MNNKKVWVSQKPFLNGTSKQISYAQRIIKQYESGELKITGTPLLSLKNEAGYWISCSKSLTFLSKIDFINSRYSYSKVNLTLKEVVETKENLLLKIESLTAKLKIAEEEKKEIEKTAVANAEEIRKVWKVLITLSDKLTETAE